LSWLLSNPGKNGNYQKGLSLACTSLGYQSEQEIRAIVPVSSSKIQRLRTVLKRGFETLHTRRAPNVPNHALADADVQAIKVDAETWEVERRLSMLSSSTKTMSIGTLGEFTPSCILHTRAFGTYLLIEGVIYLAKKIIR
jgi:hypothetical protein